MKFDILRVSPIQTPNYRLRKVKPGVLLIKFHPRIHMMALLVTILGSKNQKKYSEF
jgi:hypothetical protein